MSIIQEHINKKLTPMYKIQNINSYGEIDNFIFTPLINGEVDNESFFVHF